jgi:hypothetical protein
MPIPLLEFVTPNQLYRQSIWDETKYIADGMREFELLELEGFEVGTEKVYTILKRKIMPDTTKEQLQLRRDEIREQLAQHNGEINIELDQDPEEQAIQIEQHEVAVALIDNLRRELAAVEDKLLDYEN